MSKIMELANQWAGALATHGVRKGDGWIELTCRDWNPYRELEAEVERTENLLRQALEALEGCYGHKTADGVRRTRAIVAIKEYLK